MNDTTAHGGPAYPTAINHSNGTGIVLGMSLLDHFAGEAMPLAYAHVKERFNLEFINGFKLTGDMRAGIADEAYELAQAMIHERDRRLDRIARHKRSEELAKQMNDMKAQEGPRLDLTDLGRRR